MQNSKKHVAFNVLQRYKISILNEQKLSKSIIAERIGKDKSTIYRELRRNSDGRSGRYKLVLAKYNQSKERQIAKAENELIDLRYQRNWSVKQIDSALMAFDKEFGVDEYTSSILQRKPGTTDKNDLQYDTIYWTEKQLDSLNSTIQIK